MRGSFTRVPEQGVRCSCNGPPLTLALSPGERGVLEAEVIRHSFHRIEDDAGELIDGNTQ